MTNQTRVLVAAASSMLLLTVPDAFADWTAHADFSSCPRKYFPNPTADEGPFATQSQCEARVAEAKRGNNAVCARYSCTEGAAGSGEASSAAPGHQLDSTIERAISAGISGDISGSQAVGLVGLGMAGNALLGGLASSPEQQQLQQQQQAQQAEAERQQQAERARQQAAADEERKNRLLGEMQGVEGGGELQLMTDDEPSASAGSASSGGGELALLGDESDTQDIMGKRRAPKPKRNQPPATRVNTGPYTPGARPAGAPAAGNAGGGGEKLARNSDDAGQAQSGLTEAQAFDKGRDAGYACGQRSAGSYCGVLRDESLSVCMRKYNEGYDRGAQKLEQDLSARGAAAAAGDKGRKGATALSHPEAQGSCGNVFVQAYNNAPH